MTNLTLTSIQRYDKDKEGNPLKTKDGRNYIRLVIRCKEYGDKMLSGFDSIQTQGWREGDTIEAEVEQKGEYLNFKLPNKQDLIGKSLEEINGRLVKMNIGIQQILSHLQPKKEEEIDYPAFEGEPNFDSKEN